MLEMALPQFRLIQALRPLQIIRGHGKFHVSSSFEHDDTPLRLDAGPYVRPGSRGKGKPSEERALTEDKNGAEIFHSLKDCVTGLFPGGLTLL